MKISKIISALFFVSLPLWIVNVSIASETTDSIDAIDVSKVTLRGTTDKLEYAPNEEMSFTLTLDYGKQPALSTPLKLRWKRTGDDGVKEEGELDIDSKTPVVLKSKLGKPGFVRIYAYLHRPDGKGFTFKDKKGKNSTVWFDGGAGVQIAKIRCANREPKDFDAYWASQKERLAKVPMKFKMNKISKENAKVNIYEVYVDCAGPRPVTGYLTVPANALDKSLPAHVTYHGYGTKVQKAPNYGSPNTIRLDVNAHGYDLGKDDEYYKKFFAGIKSNGQIYAFDPIQNENPTESYFNGMVLRLMRSLEFVKSLPQWNGKDLKVSGGSQGGLQTIWAAALDADVSEAASSITWCCDFNGESKGRIGSHFRPKYAKGLDYYDAINHGKRIKCKTFISRAGLGDYCCPPSGIAALYNAMRCPKKILWVQGSTHGFVPKNPQQWEIEKGYSKK